MLLATGAIALSRKIKHEKAKKKEAKQGRLQIGDSDVAKRAFASETSQSRLLPSDPSQDRRPTQIRYEDPSDVNAGTPTTTTSSDDATGLLSPTPTIHDSRQHSRMDITSPVQSERGFVEPFNAYTDSGDESQPPPYSTWADTSSRPDLSSYSQDTDSASVDSFQTNTVSITTSNSREGYSMRIKTIGGDLKSGFPYHPALFDLNVHPEKWTAFTSQVIDSSKLSASDQASAWAAATAVALTGFVASSVLVGRSMKRSAQEKKVRESLQDASGGLGETLELWNEGYFSRRGLFVHLELSESAMKHPDQKSKTFRKGALLYSNPEDRKRKREERKFVIVVTKLDEEGLPSTALREFERDETQSQLQQSQESEEAGAVEIGSSAMPNGVCELPADQSMPVELPATEPAKIAEMDGDNTSLLQKVHGDYIRRTATFPDEKIPLDEQYQVHPTTSHDWDQTFHTPPQQDERPASDYPLQRQMTHDSLATWTEEKLDLGGRFKGHEHHQTLPSRTSGAAAGNDTPPPPAPVRTQAPRML